MADGRMIKREVADSKKLGKVKNDKARVLYFMMLPFTDIKGRIKADPELIRGRITTRLEYSEATIQNCLKALHKIGLIVLYSVNGDQYLEYTRFDDFQTLNPSREAKSKIPDPPENSGPVQEDSALSLSKVKVKDKIKHRDKVFLTEEEYNKLVEQLGKEPTEQFITDLDLYIGSHGDKYKSHYKTILNWKRMHEKDAEQKTHKKGRLYPITGKICSQQGCRFPAVYKDSSGSYDNFYCSTHLPAEIKEKYE
jgi:hypothetical protein